MEVKLCEGQIDKAATHLRKLQSLVDPVRTGPPAFAMVVTGTPFAYRRNDGIIVCPLACLKP